MRENRVNLTRYGISRFAYQELKAFCRQYPEKKAMAEACIMPGASERIGSGGGLHLYLRGQPLHLHLPGLRWWDHPSGGGGERREQPLPAAPALRPVDV